MLIACFDDRGALDWTRQYRFGNDTGPLLFVEQTSGELLVVINEGIAFLLDSEGDVIE